MLVSGELLQVVGGLVLNQNRAVYASKVSHFRSVNGTVSLFGWQVVTMPDLTSHLFIIFTIKVHTFSVLFLIGFIPFCLHNLFTFADIDARRKDLSVGNTDAVESVGGGFLITVF